MEIIRRFNEGRPAPAAEWEPFWGPEDSKGCFNEGRPAPAAE